MFIRQTKTSNSTTGELYITFRLVASERIGKQVRQRTLLNLGRQFTLAKDSWPLLCTRIEQILSGQGSLLPESAAIETLAQRYAARLVTAKPSTATVPVSPDVEYQEIDVNSLEMVRPRTCQLCHLPGIYFVGLAA